MFTFTISIWQTLLSKVTYSTLHSKYTLYRFFHSLGIEPVLYGLRYRNEHPSNNPKQPSNNLELLSNTLAITHNSLETP